jgi:sarcosine oxidase
VKTSYDVIIVGAGAMGSAASYHLARRGASVLCLEQFAVPHALGSSHGESRKIRLGFLDSALYELARRSFDHWDALQEASDQRIVYRNGGLYLGPPGCPFIDDLRKAAEQRDLPLEELDRNLVVERYPQFQIPHDYQGVLDGTAGMLRPERAVAAHVDLAMRHGAVVHGHEPVQRWAVAGRGVTVTTARSTYRAERLLICGGAWSAKLIAQLGVELSVTRQVLGWVWPKKPRLFDLDTLPGWGLDDGEGRWYYGFPMLDGSVGFKLARDWKATPVDPDAISREPTKEDEQEFRPCLQRFIPEADGPLLAVRICMYTNSPDGKFIIDRHPRHENVFVACGFSGSGFKFSPVIGEALADLALQGWTNLPIDSFRLGRF